MLVPDSMCGPDDFVERTAEPVGNVRSGRYGARDPEADII